MSCVEGTKVVYKCICILREYVLNELEKEGGREEAPNFRWSFAPSWQNCKYATSTCFFWMLVSLFHGPRHPLLHKPWGMRDEMSAKIYVCKSSSCKSVWVHWQWVEAIAFSLNQPAGWQGWLHVCWCTETCPPSVLFSVASLIWRYNVFKGVHSNNHMGSSSF